MFRVMIKKRTITFTKPNLIQVTYTNTFKLPTHEYIINMNKITKKNRVTFSF